MTIAVKEADIASQESLGTDFDGLSTDISQHVLGSVQIVWSGATGTIDGDMEVQLSNDDTNWSVTGSPFTITTGSGTHIFELTELTAKFIRISFTKNTMTDGTVDARLIAKSFE